MNKSKIFDKKFCITGVMEFFPAKHDAWEEIIIRGGNAEKGLTTSCDYLVVGQKGSKQWVYGDKGGKISKAEEWISSGRYNIKIIGENDFIKLLEESDIVEESLKGNVYFKAQKLDEIIYANEEEIAIKDDIDLHITCLINKPVENMPQVLRCHYYASSIEFHEAIKTEATFLSLLSKTKWYFKSQVRPSYVYDGHRTFSYSLSIGILLENENHINKAMDIFDNLKDIFINTGLDGELRLNTWNVKGKYGQRLYKLIQEKNEAVTAHG